MSKLHVFYILKDYIHTIFFNMNRIFDKKSKYEFCYNDKLLLLILIVKLFNKTHF